MHPTERQLLNIPVFLLFFVLLPQFSFSPFFFFFFFSSIVDDDDDDDLSLFSSPSLCMC
jgi:hypothetical protein